MGYFPLDELRTEHERTRWSAGDDEMREERNNSLGGTSVVLQAPEDLVQLSPSLSRLVPRGVQEVFEDFPSSFLSLASESAFLPLKRWLRKIAKGSRCELGIHRPGARCVDNVPASEVYLQLRIASPFSKARVKERARLGIDPYDERLLQLALNAARGDSPNMGELIVESRARNEHTILLSGGLTRVPKRCPAGLSEVLRLVGVVREGYGQAGGLLRPSEQPTLLDLKERLVEIYSTPMAVGRTPREHEQHFAAQVEQTPLPSRPQDYFAFYENSSGNFLTTNRSGKTWRFPMTMAGGDSAPGPPLSAWLEEFFDSGPFALDSPGESPNR